MLRVLKTLHNELSIHRTAKKLLASASALAEAIAGRSMSQRGVLSLVFWVSTILVVTEVFQLWQTHDANMIQAKVLTSNTASLVSEQTEETLKAADTIVATLVEQSEAEVSQPPDPTRLRALISSLARALPSTPAIVIMDPRGTPIVTSWARSPIGVNYADREYFRFHATHADRGPLIGGRVRSRVDGSSVITISRRINRPDGSFSGVVVAGVASSYFQQMLDRVRERLGGVITLLADNGSIVARSPAVGGETLTFTGGGELEKELQKKFATGGLTYTSPIDGVRRYGSYERLNRYPIEAVASLSEWELQNSWRDAIRLHTIVLLCVMLVLAVLSARTIKADRVLKLQAMQDTLTGLANRTFLNESIEREFRRGARCRRPVAVIMIDIDHFKAYNDRYGHPAGDECLRAVASTIRGCLRREGEFAARYGGEEIAVVLPDSDTRRAYGLAARMRVAVRSLGLQHVDSPHGIVTFSAGAASCVPGRIASGWRDLIGKADQALYEAKANGRDSVRAAITVEAFDPA